MRQQTIFPAFSSCLGALGLLGVGAQACSDGLNGGGSGGDGTSDGSGGASSGGTPSESSGGDAGGGPGGAAAEGGANGEGEGRYLLGAVSIDAEGNRISYAQVITELGGHFTNEAGIEANGNAVFLTQGPYFFYGLAESPTWVKYDTRSGFERLEQLSFLDYGVTYMDFANVIVDETAAVSVLTGAYVAVIWNPSDMSITGTVDLSHLQRDDLELEAFTTVTHDGLVYIPAKWVNWETPTVEQTVSVTILDPHALEIVGTAEDQRCGAGGRVTFDSAGYAYVMGDGRNQSMQSFAAAHGDPTVPNCLLRIAPGETDFEEGFFYEIPDLTGGLDSMTELEAASVDAGIAFSMMKYEDRIDPGLDRVAFEHWSVPAYKMWRIVLGDVPMAEEVSGANFSVVGFPGSGVHGKLYSSESEDGSASTVFEIDPHLNTAVQKFTMDGYFSALLPLE